MILGFHAFPNWMSGGFVGVDIFFVISGYLISSIIFSSLELDNFDIFNFYFRRLQRIFPALFVVLIFVFLLGWYAFLLDEYKQITKHIIAAITSSSNIVLFNEAGYFDSAAEKKPLLHLWSLGIEGQFYFLWPLVLIFTWKFKEKLLGVIIFFIALSFCINLYLTNFNPEAAFYLPVSRFWELLIGAFLAYISVNKPRILESHKDFQSLAGILLITSSLFLVNEAKPFPGYWALLPSMGAFFLISAGENSFFNKHILSRNILVWIGLISYPLYLWHWPILVWPPILTSELNNPLQRVLLLILSFFLAWLTHVFIEKKINSNSRIKIFYTSIASLFLISLLSYSGVIKPRNSTSNLDKILSANLDWDYPGKNFVRIPNFSLRYFFAKGGKHKTIFIGDSNMEQYAPRINKLLDQDPNNFNSAIIFGNQTECSVIHEIMTQNGTCIKTVETVKNLINDSEVSNVVFAASWLNYPNTPFAHKNFREFVTSNLKDKKVFIILNMPRGPELDPKNMFEGSRLTSITQKDIKGMKFNFEKFQKLINPINAQLKKLDNLPNVVVINPVDYLCPDNVCPIFDAVQNPLYRDLSHLTASYASRSASFIDQTLKD